MRLVVGLPPLCPGKLDENGSIRAVDLLSLLAQRGDNPACPQILTAAMARGRLMLSPS